MNCKPGDLAIRIKAFQDSVIPVGAVVRCLHFDTGISYLVGANDETPIVARGTWLVEWNGITGVDGLEFGMLDEHLRSIRDPGDDAQDETLSWLPVPSREGVEA